MHGSTEEYLFRTKRSLFLQPDEVTRRAVGVMRQKQMFVTDADKSELVSSTKELDYFNKQRIL